MTWETSYRIDVDTLLDGANIHSCIRGYTQDGKKKLNYAAPGCMDNEWGVCKARFPRALAEATHVDPTGVVVMKKQEEWLNTVTPALTYIMRSNTDVTSLASGTAIKAVIMYISDYITKTSLKTHTIFDTVRSTFQKHGDVLNGDKSSTQKAKTFMTKVVNQLSAKTELGAPFICLYMLGNPDHYTSHNFVTFYWRPYVAEVRRLFEVVDTSEDQKVIILRSKGKLIACSHVQDYIHRPSELADISLYEYVRCYERVNITSGCKSYSEDKDDGLEVLEPIIDEYDPSNDDWDDSSDRIEADISNEHISDIDSDEEDSTPSTSEINIEISLSKNTYRFLDGHPQHKTHAIKYVTNNQSRLTNFVGSIPRSDKGDLEYYHCTMLTLFKPWRSGHDLRDKTAESWSSVYDSHNFTEEEKKLMVNFNIKFECMDARDDVRAQMKKGALPDALFGSWDPSAQDDTEVPGVDMGEIDVQLYDQAYDETSAMQEGSKYRSKLWNIQTVTRLVNSVGWSDSKGTGCMSMPESISPPSIYTSTQWSAIVETCKDMKVEERRQNLHGPTSKHIAESTGTLSNENPNSFIPNRVRIIDKSYFSINFDAPGEGMTQLVDTSIEKFMLNKEQMRAFKIIANHAMSYDHEQLNMYIGGMGGTGKSQVLKALIHFFNARSESHRFIVVAPTGSAAALLGGGTYHATFGINEYADTKPGVIRSRLQGVEYVFFDEVSMLSAKDLHKIDVQLKKVMQEKQMKAFGGLNMIFCGDFAQLPPAIGGENASLYSHTIGSKSTSQDAQKSAFGKALWHQVTSVVILRQNMRQRSQSSDDSKLRTALDNMRYKACTPDDIAFLMSRISCDIEGWPSICDDRFRNESIITGTNLIKDTINLIGSRRFADETGQVLEDFFSEDSERVKAVDLEKKANRRKRQLKVITDATQQVLWEQAPSFTDKHIPGKLSLCLGLPVMIRHNYATELCMTRGQEGFVVSWQSHIGTKNQPVLDVVLVRLKNPPHDVNIEGLPTNVVPIYLRSNAISALLPNGDTFMLQRDQVELMPNFAMTAYASQGKTRPDNPVHLLGLKTGAGDATHQAYYTALSRSASAAGTIILEGLDIKVITGGCSGALRQEFRELELLDTITKLLHEGKLPVYISGVTRNEIIREFRKWKGSSYVPNTMHKSIRWSKRDPYPIDDVIDKDPSQVAIAPAATAARKKVAKYEALSKTNPRHSEPPLENTHQLEKKIDADEPKVNNDSSKCAHLEHDGSHTSVTNSLR